MACICRCPKAAIEYGKHSRGLPRYTFPAMAENAADGEKAQNQGFQSQGFDQQELQNQEKGSIEGNEE